MWKKKKKKKAAFSPLYLNLASTVACLLLATCSHSTRHWPYFLLIIMWMIKVQVHEAHINHLQWARNGPGLSHCSQHKLRPKYSWCKLGILFPPAEFTVTCLSLKTCHLPGSQQGTDPSLPSHHGDHWLLCLPLVSRWADDMLFVLKISLASFGHPDRGLSICPVAYFEREQSRTINLLPMSSIMCLANLTTSAMHSATSFWYLTLYFHFHPCLLARWMPDPAHMPGSWEHAIPPQDRMPCETLGRLLVGGWQAALVPISCGHWSGFLEKLLAAEHIAAETPLIRGTYM